MKTKSFMIILLLLCSITGFSQVKPIVEFESGYWNRQISLTSYCNVQLPMPSRQTRIDSDISNYPIYSAIKLGCLYKGFTLYTDILSQYKMQKLNSYAPKQINYKIGAEYNYKSLFIGYEHMCSHPIINNPIQYDIMFREDYDRIYLKFKIL